MAESNFQVLSFRQSEGPKARRYQKRKTHAKSKTGCTSCKVKRIKCGEERPSCKRCQRTGTPCIYPTDRGSSYTLEQSSADLLCASSPYSLDISLNILPEVITNPSTPYGTPRITLLNHFVTIFSPLASFGATAGPSSMINLGLSYPHLLDGILAVSASHLRLHSPSPRPHRVAEHFQQNLAVRGLRTALSEPLDQSGSDALLLSSMMLNLLAFSIVDTGNVRNSWVFSKEKERLSWFSLQLGYKPLLIATTPYRGEGTMLSWMFSASDDSQRSYNGEPQPLHNVPSHWLALCGLSAEDNTDTNLFHEPIRILNMVKDLEAAPENYFLYLAFVGRLDFDFRDLLEDEDERAMWVLGYWLGLMSRFDFWWMKPRSTLDHKAVVLWFEERRVRERGGGEGVMWEALLRDLKMAPLLSHQDGPISVLGDIL